MGAGRCFALLAALAAAAPVAASAAVGQDECPTLDAKLGVGPYEALEQGSGMELRDAQNRPVSRAALAAALGRSQRAQTRAGEAAAGARLLADWLDALRLMRALAAGLRLPRPELAGPGVAAAGLPKPPELALSLSSLPHARPPAAAPPRAEGPWRAPAPDRALVLPLRC